MLTPEEEIANDAAYPMFELFALCVNCGGLLAGAFEHNSQLGDSVLHLAKVHRRYGHDVYVGPRSVKQIYPTQAGSQDTNT